MDNKFWKDIWFGKQILLNTFHRLYEFDLNRDCSIVDGRIKDRWNYQLHHYIRGCEELRQLMVLMNNLGDVSLSI